MKLQVLQENFSKALSLTSRFANSRAQLPVLANVLISAKRNKLTISSTNLEISVSITIGAKIEETGEITVPAKSITDLVSNLTSGTIELLVQKEKLKIKTPSFSSTLTGMNSSDFPAIPQSISGNVLGLPKEDILSALSCVLFAASTDETRPVLTGVLLIFKGKELYLVATDGFRLSQKKILLKTSKGLVKEQRMILPKNALSELSRLSNEEETLNLSYKKGDSQVIFEVDNTILSSRTIEGEYPDFGKIIPKESKIKIDADKEELLRAVKLASVFARDSANVVRMVVKDDEIELLAESSQAGSQETKVDAKVKGDIQSKKSLTIAFNYRFLEDFLNAVKGDGVQIELTDANSPGVFTDPKDKDFLHLIMPVRLQD